MNIHLHINEKHSETEIHIYTAEYNDEIEQLMHSLKTKTQQTLIGYKETDLYVLKLDDIYAIVIEDAKVWIHTDDDEFEGRFKLYEIEEMFPQTLVRINKSTLIHIDKIRTIKARLLNTPQLLLCNDVQFSISRKYYPLLKAALGVVHGGEKS